MISIKSPWLGHVTPNILKNFKLSLLILMSFYSSSAYYTKHIPILFLFGYLISVYTRSIPIFSYWLAPVQHIYGSLALDAFQQKCEMIQLELECRQCSLLPLDCVQCNNVYVPTLSRASHLFLECIQCNLECIQCNLELQNC